MKKRFLALSLALAMCLAMLTGCGGGNDAATDDGGSTDDAAPGTPEVTWVASCANADDHPAVQGVHKFAELVEEKSGGRMHIDVFANAQLASDRDCIEGMQMNTIQSGIMVSSALAGFTDELLVFDLPFLFENSAQGQAVCDSDVGQQILGTLEDIGIKGLGWMEYGMRNITNSVRPIEKPVDLQGIKIRTMENPIHMAAFQVMGADPTPMAFGELFTALQQGTIDAQENPLSVDGALPDDLKAIVDEAGVEACQWEREYLAEVEVQWLDELETAGTQINYPDKAPFVDAMSSVYNQFVGDGDDMVSPELLEQVREIISQVE